MYEGEPLLQLKRSQDGSHLPNKGQTLVESYQAPPRKMEWTYVEETETELIDGLLVKSGQFGVREMLARRLEGRRGRWLSSSSSWTCASTTSPPTR